MVLYKPTTALITPSYAADFERCRLLCDSVDRFVIDKPDHYLLVDNDDHDQFLQLEGPRRHVINEQDILPDWLKSVRPGFRRDRRKIWFSTRTWPMRGWHVQQLRRMSIAFHIQQGGLLYCDSDMLFIKPFDTGSLWVDGSLRLYRKDGGINDQLPDGGRLHKIWTEHAAHLNGLPVPIYPSDDYINNLVSWRREDVIAMCSRIEDLSSKHWIAAIGSRRTFSECQIYGAYVDQVKHGAGHWHEPGGLCETYWAGTALTKASLEQFLEQMSPRQVAIGIQSFTGTDPAMLRELIAA